MKVKTFIDNDIDKIIRQAHKELGDQLFVVKQEKVVTKKGLFKKQTGYKVIAATLEDEDKESIKKEAIEEYEKINLNSLNKQNNTNNNIDTDLLQENFSELQKTLRGMAIKMDNLNTSKKHPAAIQFLERTLKEHDTDSDTIDRIIRDITLNLPFEEQNDQNVVNDMAKTIIENKFSKPKSIASVGARKRKISMFIGSTGVGKTTSISKLATILNSDTSQKRSSRVGVISLDVYREGAIEQLANMCGYTNIPLLVANNAESFADALNQFQDKEYVFVDTTGRSQHNIAEIRKVEEILGDHIHDIDETYLVMSATTKYRDMIDIYKSFNWLNVNRVIFSKLDETQKIGNILSFVDSHPDVNLSYVTTGQTVPSDITLLKTNIITDRMFNTNSISNLI